MKAKEKKVYVYHGIVMLMACLAMVMFFGKVVFGDVSTKIYTTYSALIQKEWDDNVDESDIPEEINVEYKVAVANPDYDPASPSNAKQYIFTEETVTLSKANNWEEVIEGYNNIYGEGCIVKNSFKEEKISGFISSVSESEDRNDEIYYVKITNKKVKPTEPETTVPEESEPEPTEPTEPTDPTEPTEPTDPSEPHKPSGGGNSGGGSSSGGGGSSSGGGGGTPGKPVTPVTPQTQEPQTPD